jgi:hypothetical protein
LGFFSDRGREEWFRNNAPDRLNEFLQVEKGNLEKWKSKILKTEIPCEKIKKISDLPDAPETAEYVDNVVLFYGKTRKEER